MSLSLSAGAIPGPRKDPEVAAALGRHRKRMDFLIRALCVLAMLVSIGFLISCLLYTSPSPRD